MLFGSLCLCLSSYIGWMSESLYAGLIPIIVVFSGIAFVIPIGTAKALAPFEHVAGSASALLGFMQMGLASLSTGIMSLIHDSSVFKLPFMFTLLTALSLLVFFIFIFARRGKQRHII